MATKKVKKDVKATATSSDETMKKILELANRMYADIEKRNSPDMDIPIRSLSNVKYDEDKQMLFIGDKAAKRKFLNTAHTRKFMQTVMVAEFCYNHLLKTGLHTSIRDMYYGLKKTIGDSKVNTVDEQGETNICAVDLEVALNLIREDLNLIANPTGKVVGPAVVEDVGDRIDLSKMGSGGWGIPSVVDLKFKECSADYILVIEKYAAFARLNEDKFWDKHNCMLITTEGQAARGARRLINRMANELDLPVYVCTDSDGYGWYIYSVLKYGSMALAHTSDRLATPQSRFLGLTMSDIKDFDIEEQMIKAEAVDIKRTKEIKAYPWFQTKEWQKQLDLALKLEKKAEIEALTKRGIQFLSKEYLPTKIENKDFLP